MDKKARESEGTGEPCDYRKDFQVLTTLEKREVLKIAKHLLKLQKQIAVLADASAYLWERKNE